MRQGRLVATLSGAQERHSIAGHVLSGFRRHNRKQFEGGFRRWVGGMVPALSRTIAVDGKTLRGSGKCADSPVHLVSAFATDQGWVLAQEKVAGKSNEITAIPELLQALYLLSLIHI